MKTPNQRMKTSWWALKIALGVMPIVAGLDKFFNKLTDWGMYLGPAATKVTHLSTPAFMHIVGVVEMIAGVLVLTRWTRYAAYIVSGWLVAISLSLLMQALFLDIAVRDLELALAAFVLAKLTEIRESVDVAEPAQGTRQPVHVSQS